jgi:dephospho-CoA kinase
MNVLGLTGNIGSGKSSVGEILRQLGCPVVDADREAHRTYKAGSVTWQEIVAAFGSDIVAPDGEIDRQALGSRVFKEPEALARLNAIVHPATRERVERRLTEFNHDGYAWATIEATLLIESGWTDMVTQLWVVAAPVDLVVARLVVSRDLSEADIRSRIAAQMPAKEKMLLADEILYNDGNLEDLRRRVEQLWSKLAGEHSPG